MKENTKYSEYRFIGKINVDENQPWFDFATSKPWDDPEIPWVIENKVRREILLILAKGPKTFEEIYKNLNFSPIPLLISKKDYECKVKFQWDKVTIENHLLNLERYHLINYIANKYELAFPIFKIDTSKSIEKYILKIAENWIKIIKELKEEINLNLDSINNKTLLYGILIERALEKLYELLKKEDLLSKEPNIKVLWAEQLRKIKFEEWINKNF